MDATTDAAPASSSSTRTSARSSDMAEAFAGDRVAPNALDWDRNRHFPVDVIRETGPLGFGGIYVQRRCRRFGASAGSTPR